MTQTLDAALASRFAATALGHVTREYPNHIMHVLTGPQDARTPRDMHPIFFGSFDWHSCVHGWWTLFTLYRLHPGMAEAPAIRVLADDLFTAEKVMGEAAYLARPEARGFERPYGWAWLLMLAAEVERHDTDEGRRWAEILRPLAGIFADRFKAFLPLADYPVRTGTHYNTAFALRLTLDYADVHDPDLAALCRDAARRWHAEDRDCQAWEPSQDEFLSPALMEAVLMRRVLSPDDFAAWFDAFLPALSEGRPASLLTPARVSDRADGKIAHLDGLNLSRGWCWREIIAAFPVGDARRAIGARAAAAHLDAALTHVTGDYMGEHWLASFALLALLEP
ncbi:DUF2891 domain-containing protein [Brevundimonas naejangsanensis]|uniref:DUF2891 domain-containing protein n=1 Tax=Brevundimonas naejangsanensis TaxID=588932 RepID=A0A494RH41_9CAUL|nr:DUF2891 domain-containing protein [Brevundimonas naejangsanensis]AYG95661.1 DUF2891 domain-containing protein [Brevundimonas naejangsanensis]